MEGCFLSPELVQIGAFVFYVSKYLSIDMKDSIQLKDRCTLHIEFFRQHVLASTFLYLKIMIIYLYAHVNSRRDSLPYRLMEESPMKQIHAEKYRQIGLKIAYYRKLRGFTQEELAEQIGLTPAFIGHLEAPNITKALSLDTLFDIAVVLEVSPSKFLSFDDI